jgi:hypothetical protein
MCQRLNVPDPNTMTPEEVTQNEEESVRCLATLKALAPKLRDEHLRHQLEEERTRGDAKDIQAIIALPRVDESKATIKR